jgi:hypothetical protein
MLLLLLATQHGLRSTEAAAAAAGMPEDSLQDSSKIS